MPFLDKATEDFVLGQRSGFGKDMDKEYKNSSVKKRQRDLIRFLTAQGEEETKNNKIMDDRFEKSINSPAYASAQNLNNFAGSGREVKYNLVGRGRVMADPNPNNPFRDIYEFARANPQAFETMVQGTVAQSPTKILGYGAEQFTGDSTTGNRISESVLDELTQQRDGKPGGRFGFRPEMTDEEKRVAANDFYGQQRIDNEGRDMAKGMLLEGGFTTDATYGDALDTASWLIPGPGMAVKGLGVGVKASRLALAAAKASGFAGDVSSGFKMGVGAFAGMPLGTAGGGSGFRLGKNAVDEANRVRETLNRSIGDLEAELGLLNADDFAGKHRIEAQIARQREFMANDATLQQADITPDVRNVDRKDLIGYKLVDPTNGTWGASIRKMTRNDIAKSLKATLKNGFERQKGSGMQPDELPDFKSKDWEDAVDRFIAEADADNLVRTTGPDDEAINWLSLANDHIDALKNPDKPGSNTIDNLIASYGRLNSQMGNKANR